MGLLNRQQILDSDDRRTERVAVPEWGGEVLIRGLSGTDRDEFEASLQVKNGKKRDVNLRNVRAKLVVLCLVDETGKPLFSIEDIQRLGNKSAAALGRCFDRAKQLSGLGDEDIDELAKNSATDQSDVSISA
ncbi:MAG: hypothetical protein H8K09_13100 [Nitrospira sp.]|nr:hypothetical protein [Nitrospira sp.]